MTPKPNDISKFTKQANYKGKVIEISGVNLGPRMLYYWAVGLHADCRGYRKPMGAIRAAMQHIDESEIPLWKF